MIRPCIWFVFLLLSYPWKKRVFSSCPLPTLFFILVWDQERPSSPNQQFSKSPHFSSVSHHYLRVDSLQLCQVRGFFVLDFSNCIFSSGISMLLHFLIVFFRYFNFASKNMSEVPYPTKVAQVSVTTLSNPSLFIHELKNLKGGFPKSWVEVWRRIGQWSESSRGRTIIEVEGN